MTSTDLIISDEFKAALASAFRAGDYVPSDKPTTSRASRAYFSKLALASNTMHYAIIDAIKVEFAFGRADWWSIISDLITTIKQADPGKEIDMNERVEVVCTVIEQSPRWRGAEAKALQKEARVAELENELMADVSLSTYA